MVWKEGLHLDLSLGFFNSENLMKAMNPLCARDT